MATVMTAAVSRKENTDGQRDHGAAPGKSRRMRAGAIARRQNFFARRGAEAVRHSSGWAIM
jgi:hypothetical protein